MTAEPPELPEPATTYRPTEHGARLHTMVRFFTHASEVPHPLRVCGRHSRLGQWIVLTETSGTELARALLVGPEAGYECLLSHERSSSGSTDQSGDRS